MSRACVKINMRVYARERGIIEGGENDYGVCVCVCVCACACACLCVCVCVCVCFAYVYIRVRACDVRVCVNMLRVCEFVTYVNQFACVRVLACVTVCIWSTLACAHA